MNQMITKNDYLSDVIFFKHIISQKETHLYGRRGLLRLLHVQLKVNETLLLSHVSFIF
jgi:hypothetical protein